jgi:hypothetical protein
MALAAALGRRLLVFRRWCDHLAVLAPEKRRDEDVLVTERVWLGQFSWAFLRLVPGGDKLYRRR